MIAAFGEAQKVVAEVTSELGGSSSVAGLCRRESAVGTVAPLSADNVVGATATLLGPSLLSVHNSFGSRLDNLCRFSFKRTVLFRAGASSHKRRKIAFEEKLSSSQGGIRSPSQIEVNFLGAEQQGSYVEKRPVQQQSSRSSVFGHVEEDLIHVSPHGGEVHRDCTEQGEKESSPMLRRGNPRYGDIPREELHVVRPASLPNMHHEDSGQSFDTLVHSSSDVRESHPAKDVVRQTPVNDSEGKGAIVPCGPTPCGMVQSNCSCIREVLGDYLTDHGSRESTNSHTEAQGSSWDFKVVASVKTQNRNLTSTDVIGTIAFEKTNEYFATGGIARKIRVYAYSSLASGLSSSDEVDEDEDEEDYKQRRLRKRRNSATDIDHARCCVNEVCTPAKLSSLQWHKERPNLIACGDYDGVVAEWDVERSCAVSERDENGGQRIWSIDYSKDFPDLIASASDDGTVRVWDGSSDKSVAILTPPTYSSICCAEFGPVSSSLIALASADSNVYLYDTRWLSTPLLTLAHHNRAASYVRFLNRHSLVSSSIDSSVKLWDISSMSSTFRRTSPATSEHCNLPMKSFDSHYNVRNFTGLSVRAEGGLIACGSETNQAFVYNSQRSSPLLIHSFDYNYLNANILGSWNSDSLASKGHHVEHPEGDAANSLIVSAVCWRTKPNDCTLVAANSDGVLRVLSGSQT